MSGTTADLYNKKILIVDDEPEILQMIENALFDEGFYNIHTAKNCREAQETVRNCPVALFLLDINLPDGNGFMLYQEIRRQSKAPVMFLTARGDEEDRVRGFDLGADDYIVKPFLMRELVLRVKALLRRTYGVETKEPGFWLGNRYIDFERAAVVCGGAEEPLTAKEFILMKKLWENRNRIVTNDGLCMAAWGEAYYGHENTLMVHIRRLRKKVEAEPSAPKHLITVKGLGYKLVTANE
ncbi:MAG: response regulator transcription factor [Muribaculum sp.]|nr:response regulator transcription factor [Muribaculum sp.]